MASLRAKVGVPGGTWLPLIVCLLLMVTTNAWGADFDRFQDAAEPGTLVPGADALGPIREDLPVAPVLENGAQVGWAFVNSDFAPAVGYSGKPIHVVVGIDQEGVLTGAQLVKHYEPIVLVGIPEARIREVIEGYAGLDVTEEAAGERHQVDIVSGATVTVMVIDDSIVRAAIKVARALGLGGLEEIQRPSGPRQVIDPAVQEDKDWFGLVSEGSIGRLSLDLGQVNQAFARSGNPEAARRRQGGPADATFIDLFAALVTIPTLGRSLLGPREHAALSNSLEDGQHAILVAGRGRYSFKGSGYVRGGIFDRIVVLQGDRTYRFHDRDHKRLGGIAAEGAPAFQDVDLFRLPADAEFDPAEPWRLQLLVSRPTGPTEKAFLIFDLAYDPPDQYFRTIEPAQTPEAGSATAAPAVGEADLADDDHDPLWLTIWRDRQLDIAILASALLLLTVAFFFQGQLVRFPKLVFWGRIAFLAFTLVWLGWIANAQLSVVNVMTFSNALLSDFSWTYFLMDPLIFMLWFAVAAALLFWGRGAYCGWLCPFGALQELTNRLAKLARVPQWHVPFGLHERLWPIKYMLFLGLFAMSLYSLDTAERLAEVEPFKTAIILKFMRDWPFVVFALGVLAIGLFVERFYCRYLCPLGAALAIPGRMRMFAWLRRYRECGDPCQICARECMVQAIHPEGHINPNECLYCLHCQVVYKDDQKCPVCVRAREKRLRQAARTGGSAKPVLPKAPQRPAGPPAGAAQQA